MIHQIITYKRTWSIRWLPYICSLLFLQFRYLLLNPFLVFLLLNLFEFEILLLLGVGGLFLRSLFLFDLFTLEGLSLADLGLLRLFDRLDFSEALFELPGNFWGLQLLYFSNCEVLDTIAVSCLANLDKVLDDLQFLSLSESVGFACFMLSDWDWDLFRAVDCTGFSVDFGSISDFSNFIFWDK